MHTSPDALHAAPQDATAEVSRPLSNDARGRFRVSDSPQFRTVVEPKAVVSNRGLLVTSPVAESRKAGAGILGQPSGADAVWRDVTSTTSINYAISPREVPAQVVAMGCSRAGHMVGSAA